VAKQNSHVAVTKNYIKNEEEVAAKPNIGHGHVASAGTNRLQVSRPQSGGGQGMRSKRMRLDVVATQQMSNSASWERDRRTEMIVNQCIVGPGVVMDGHYRGEDHTWAEQPGCSNKQTTRVSVRGWIDAGEKNVLIGVAQTVGPTGRASAGSVLDVGAKKSWFSCARYKTSTEMVSTWVKLYAEALCPAVEDYGNDKKDERGGAL
jgi:hypothetical protein